MKIRKALASESELLTKITLNAKRYWNYPEEYIQLWKEDLTITADYIKSNLVVVCMDRKEIVGYFSIIIEEYSSLSEQQAFLDNLFIDPRFIGKGIGTKLLNEALNWCNRNEIDQLFVVSDPNAKGFYLKSGFSYLSERATNIPQRTLPLLVYNINQLGKKRGSIEA